MPSVSSKQWRFIMKMFLRLILLVSVLTLTLPIITCAQSWVKDKDVTAEVEYTDDTITSTGIEYGSGLNKMWFQVNEDSLTDSVIYSTTHELILTKQGTNTVRVWVSDNVGWVSDVEEVRVNVDAKPPFKKKFNIKDVFIIPSQ
jgi:hypothetical protein